MKYLKLVPVFFLAIVLSSQVQASTNPVEKAKTAESAFAFAEEMQPFDAEIFKVEIKDLEASEKIKLIKMSLDNIEQAELSDAQGPTIGYYILAVIFPPAAVGIYTDWSMPTTLYSVCWTLLAYVPGVIHAFIVLGR